VKLTVKVKVSQFIARHYSTKVESEARLSNCQNLIL
jgi:hypothetical protein